MVQSVLFFLLGLLMLYGGAEYLVRGSSRLAVMARIPPLIIGVTVVAFGTSSPEFIVSFVAAWSDKIDVAMGNIVGSNIANIGLILGISAIIRSITLKDTAIAREYIWMISSSILFWLFTFKGVITHIEGVILFSGLIIFTFYLIYVTLRDRKNNLIEKEIPVESEKFKNLTPIWRVIIYLLQIVIGIALLVWGSKITIEAATYIARVLGVSEVIIGLSLVAFGTSLPELATAIISIIRREKAILIGNILGSNIFNILFVGGAVSTIYSIAVKPRLIQIDIPIMLVISIVLFPLLFMRRKISRISGISLLAFYLLYIFYIYFQS
jgi:cation:H+ antiporter